MLRTWRALIIWLFVCYELGSLLDFFFKLILKLIWALIFNLLHIFYDVFFDVFFSFVVQVFETTLTIVTNIADTIIYLSGELEKNFIPKLEWFFKIIQGSSLKFYHDMCNYYSILLKDIPIKFKLVTDLFK